MKIMLEGQFYHFILLSSLLSVVIITTRSTGDFDGRLLGLSSNIWFWVGIAVPIFHQMYTLVVWRLELHGEFISKIFGKERGFSIYSIGFSILISCRPISIVLLGISNYGSLGLAPWKAVAIGAVFIPPSAYLMYSVIFYFTLKRAYGADHFFEEYRKMPMEKRGIFKYTSNGMYIYGFMSLWGLAFFGNSSASLVVAFFNHCYIWIHFYCVETPDMNRIYGEKEE